MKSGTDPAMKMSGMMMGMIRGQLGENSAFKDACTETALIGLEKVTVPAGTSPRSTSTAPNTRATCGSTRPCRSPC